MTDKTFRMAVRYNDKDVVSVHTTQDEESFSPLPGRSTEDIVEGLLYLSTFLIPMVKDYKAGDSIMITLTEEQ